MPDGLVLLDGDEVGVYSIFVDGTMRISLSNGKDVEETLTNLAENGMGLMLLGTPAPDDKD